MDTTKLFNDMVTLTKGLSPQDSSDADSVGGFEAPITRRILRPVYSISQYYNNYVIDEYRNGEYITIATINRDAVAEAIALVARANKEAQ